MDRVSRRVGGASRILRLKPPLSLLPWVTAVLTRFQKRSSVTFDRSEAVVRIDENTSGYPNLSAPNSDLIQFGSNDFTDREEPCRNTYSVYFSYVGRLRPFCAWYDLKFDGLALR